MRLLGKGELKHLMSDYMIRSVIGEPLLLIGQIKMWKSDFAI